jgi:hypothetical protein
MERSHQTVSSIIHLSHIVCTYLIHYILDDISCGHGELLDARPLYTYLTHYNLLNG